MTDRRTPGVFSDYMAGVCADLAARLDQLGVRPPAWADAVQLADLAALYRRRSTKFRDDAHRQREQAGNSTCQEGPSR
jgi:MoxR-like ATPase